MSEFAPNPAAHIARETMRRVGMSPQGGSAKGGPPQRARGPNYGNLLHPMPGYLMWRGNTTKYQYNTSFVARWGEGDTKHRYHQYFAHAKDPADYDKPGRDYESLQVRQGRLVVKPLPRPQYVLNPEGKPTAWSFRSWADLLSTLEPWQREVHYAEHVPEHLGAQRPLCPLSPSTYHQHPHLAYMTGISVTVCPFFFGYAGSRSVQRAAIDFYRRCLSARAMLPKEQVQLHYSIDPVAPRIEVTWLDGTKYSPPILEGCTAQGLIQSIMEEAWLMRDKLEASGKNLQPLSIDDYKWNELIAWKKAKKKAAAKK